MFLKTLGLVALSVTLTACNITGSAQKGPFKPGSSVSASKLNRQAAPIVSSTINTQVTDSQGGFSVDRIEWSGWTELVATGQYFDEFTNSNSSATLTLHAITRKDRRFDTANINLFTHFAAARIRQLVAEGQNRNNAWRNTQVEMAQLFGLSTINRNFSRGVEQLDLLNGSGRFRNDNANLLLFTGAFLASGGNGQSLQLLTDDFADDGHINGDAEPTFIAIAVAANDPSLLNTLTQNLSANGASNPPNQQDLQQLPTWVNDDSTVIDSVAPTISIGNNLLNLIVGSPFVDDVSAFDNIDGDITSSIVTSGDIVDTNTLGNYEISYNVSDNAGNAAVPVTRTVIVTEIPDSTPPIITVTDPQENTVEVNSTYTDSGATASDDRDENVSVQIDLSNVDTSTIDGTFDVIYTAADSAENTATETRTVTVVDTIPPVITLNGGDVTITEGTSYIDGGASTTDNSGIAASLTTNIPTDINTVGTHQVTYTAVDSKGNTSTAIRMVTVEEDTSTPTTEISGAINEVDGTPISSATISVYKDGEELIQDPVFSDSLGNYLLSLEKSSNYTLVVQKFGYATQVIPVTNLVETIITLHITMLNNVAVVENIDPTMGVVAGDNEGSSVAIEADDFAGNDTLQLTITSIDTSNPTERSAIPGDLVNPYTLFFVGLTEFTFTKESNNQEVNLAVGNTAEITIPITRNVKSDGSAYELGDSIQLYYLNEDTGTWTQEGTANVVVENDSPTGLAATGTISHFSWWALSYPSDPAIAGSFNTNSAYDIAVSPDGQRAYIADGEDGLKVVDISDYSNISLIASLPLLPAYEIELSSDSNTLYVPSGTDGIHIINVSDPNNLTTLGIIPRNDIIPEFKISSDGTKMYASNADNTIFDVIDISNPSSTSIISSISPTGLRVKDIAISSDGATAYIASGSAGLIIFDISDPFNITMSGQFITGGFASGVAVSNDGNRTFVSDFTGKKLHIIDTSNPANLSRIGVTDLTDQGRDVVISSTETTAYIAQWETGLQVVDISDTANPQVIGNVDTTGSALNLAISLDDKHVFIADVGGGLQIVDTEKALLGNSIPPTITINGANYIDHPSGTPYVDLGASAVDDLDGAVTVTTSGVVDVNTVGELYTVTYTASDSSGNTSIARRTVYIEQGAEVTETGNTITDAVTGLEVQDNITVTTNGSTWSGAISYCQNLSLNGQTDWRLPNQTEMDDIVDRGYFHPFNDYIILTNSYDGYIPNGGGPNTVNDDTYWTSVEDGTDGYYINNDDGVFSFTDSKSAIRGVRCVRG